MRTRVLYKCATDIRARLVLGNHQCGFPLSDRNSTQPIYLLLVHIDLSGMYYDTSLCRTIHLGRPVCYLFCSGCVLKIMFSNMCIYLLCRACALNSLGVSNFSISCPLKTMDKCVWHIYLKVYVCSQCIQVLPWALGDGHWYVYKVKFWKILVQSWRYKERTCTRSRHVWKWCFCHHSFSSWKGWDTYYTGVFIWLNMKIRHTLVNWSVIISLFRACR